MHDSYWAQNKGEVANSLGFWPDVRKQGESSLGGLATKGDQSTSRAAGGSPPVIQPAREAGGRRDRTQGLRQESSPCLRSRRLRPRCAGDHANYFCLELNVVYLLKLEVTSPPHPRHFQISVCFCLWVTYPTPTHCIRVIYITRKVFGGSACILSHLFVFSTVSLSQIARVVLHDSFPRVTEID